MEASEQKRTALTAGAVVCVIVCLLMVGREVSGEQALGESRNPNFGHASASRNAHGPGQSNQGQSNQGQSNVGHTTQDRLNPGPAGGPSKDQYYQNLKFNRPDLSEAELRQKTEQWWKIKNGDAQPTGG